MADKHIHKLKRHTYKSGNQIYFCILDCNYKISPALAIGKKSICNRCGLEFVMTEYTVRLAKPHCEGCHKPKGGIDDSPLLELDGVIIPVQPAVVSLRERLNAALKKATTEVEEDEI